MIKLELERRKRNLTQKQLGKETKITSAEICRIEKGNKPFPSHIKRLSEYFNMPEEALLQEVK
jgi:transcriptional regulator with XRE-family HTH domain